MLFRNRVYWGKAGRIVPAILLVALSVTLMVGLVAAEVVDGKPATPAGASEVSPLVPYAPTTEAVSYTHLDVYKRQPFGRGLGRGSCAIARKTLSLTLPQGGREPEHYSIPK